MQSCARCVSLTKAGSRLGGDGLGYDVRGTTFSLDWRSRGAFAKGARVAGPEFLLRGCPRDGVRGRGGGDVVT